MMEGKWLKRIFWAVIGIGLAGVIIVSALLWWFATPYTFISIENETESPVRIVRLSYDGKSLMEEAELVGSKFFQFLRGGEVSEIILTLKRPEASSNANESHIFEAVRCPYEYCYYDIFIRLNSVKFHDYNSSSTMKKEEQKNERTLQ